MSHVSRKRIQIDHEGLHSHILAQQIDVHARQIALADLFERFRHPLVILVIGVCDSTFPDGLIAVQVVVDIVEIGAAA